MTDTPPTSPSAQRKALDAADEVVLAVAVAVVGADRSGVVVVIVIGVSVPALRRARTAVVVAVEGAVHVVVAAVDAIAGTLTFEDAAAARTHRQQPEGACQGEQGEMA